MTVIAGIAIAMHGDFRSECPGPRWPNGTVNTDMPEGGRGARVIRRWQPTGAKHETLTTKRALLDYQ